MNYVVQIDEVGLVEEVRQYEGKFNQEQDRHQKKLPPLINEQCLDTS